MSSVWPETLSRSKIKNVSFLDRLQLGLPSLQFNKKIVLLFQRLEIIANNPLSELTL